MTDASPKLGLPYIQPSQAQKHVTHNEAIQGLDTLVQLRIAAFGAETPPDTPGVGESYALGVAPGLAWAGQDGKLATWNGTAWQFLDPQEGWLAWDVTDTRLRVYSGGIWSIPDLSGEQTPKLGIATAPDDTNRLAVASDAVLLTHAGTDQRLKLNKASETDTASLLFQSNWTGHAEMGLAGDTGFSIKVSADGSSWTQVMHADPTGLQVDVPLVGAAVQGSATDTTAGRLMRADYGYGPGNLLGAVSHSGGVPTGAVVEHGSNANGQYTRFADGTQICWHVIDLGSIVAEGAGTFADPYRAVATNWNFPAVFVAGQIPTVQATGGCPAASVSATRRVSVSSIRNADRMRAYQIQVTRLSGDATVDSTTVRLLAVGRWF